MEVRFKSLNEAEKYLLNLLDKEIKSTTEWNPYQIFAHCAKTIDYSMAGYPLLKPVIIRNTIGKIAIGKFIRQGYMKHNLLADVPGSPSIENSGSTQEGIQILCDSITRFQSNEKELKMHLLFGQLSKKQYDYYFAMHIADHLSSLSIK